MKSRLVVLAILVMVALTPAVSSACWVTDLVVSVPDLVCSSTYEQQQDAAAMLLALGLAQVTGVEAQQIQSALVVIKNGGCFLLSQLKEAFEIVDATNASLVQAKGARFAAAVKLPEYPALRGLVK